MIHQEEDLLEAIYDEKYRMEYKKTLDEEFNLAELFEDNEIAKDVLKNLKRDNEVCIHCGLPIEYDAHDTAYFHKILAWGHNGLTGSTQSKDYNNGYWCQKECRTSAIPRIRNNEK